MRIVPSSHLAALAVAILLLATGPAGAQTLRPLETETAAVLPSGTTQISLGTSYFRNRRYPHFTPSGFLDSQDFFTAPELEVRVGAGDWVEFQLRYELRAIDENRSDGTDSNQFGGGDAEIFTKIRFLREGDRIPAIGAMFGIKLPNASRDDRLGTDETDFEVQLMASKDFGPVAAHFNVGLQILGNPGPLDGSGDSGSGQDDPFIFSLAAVTAPLLPEHTGAYSIRGLLAFDGAEGSRFDNDGYRFAGGFQVTRSDWTVYGGVSAGISGAAEDVGARLGVTYAFELERLRGLFD
jgi:hypothetical protein